jgi:hypothetical protein
VSIIESLDRLDEAKKTRIERINVFKKAIDKYLIDEEPEKCSIHDFGTYAIARYTFSNDRVIYVHVENNKENTALNFGGRFLCSWVYPIGKMDVAKVAVLFANILRFMTEIREKVHNIRNKLEANGLRLSEDDFFDDLHTPGNFDTSTRLIVIPPPGYNPRFRRIKLPDGLEKNNLFLVMHNSKGVYVGNDEDKVVEMFTKYALPKTQMNEDNERLGNLSQLDPWVIDRIKHYNVNRSDYGTLPKHLGENSQITTMRLTSGPKKLWDDLCPVDEEGKYSYIGIPKISMYVLIWDGEQVALFTRSLKAFKTEEAIIYLKPSSVTNTDHTAGVAKNKIKTYGTRETAERIGFGEYSPKRHVREISFRDFSNLLKRITENSNKTHTSFKFLAVSVDLDRLKARNEREIGRQNLVPLPSDPSYQRFLITTKNSLYDRLKAFKAAASTCKTVDDLVVLMTDKTFGLSRIIFDDYEYNLDSLNQYEFGQLLFQLYGDIRPNETASVREKRLKQGKNSNILTRQVHVSWTRTIEMNKELIDLINASGKEIPPHRIQVVYKVVGNQIVPALIRFIGDSPLSASNEKEFVVNESINEMELFELGIVPDPSHEYCNTAVASFVMNGRANAMIAELLLWKSKQKFLMSNSYTFKARMIAGISGLNETKKAISELSQEVFYAADFAHTEEIDKNSYARFFNRVWNFVKDMEDKALAAQMALSSAGQVRAFLKVLNSVSIAAFSSTDADTFKRKLVGDTCITTDNLEQPKLEDPGNIDMKEARADNSKIKLDAVAKYLVNLYDIDMVPQEPNILYETDWYRGFTKNGITLTLFLKGKRVAYKFNITNEFQEEFMVGNDVRAFANKIHLRVIHYDTAAELRNEFSKLMTENGFNLENLHTSHSLKMTGNHDMRVVVTPQTTPSGSPGIEVYCSGGYQSVKFYSVNVRNIPKYVEAITTDFKDRNTSYPQLLSVMNSLMVKTKRPRRS